MIINPEDLRVGSLVFVRSNTMLSKAIRYFLDFDYSHVAYYIGMGKLIEADIGGVQINPVARYVDNDFYMVEVINMPLTQEQLAHMTTFIMAKLHEEYDYTLFLGDIISRLMHRARVRSGLFNRAAAWICSELIAAGLEEVGSPLSLPASQVTPKDLYRKFHLTGETTHDTKR